MYKKLLILLSVVAVLTVVLSALPVHGESEIYENVLRLHVIANSDSDEDQALKLQVRDKILEETEKLFENCNDRQEAQALLENNLEYLRTTAQEYVSNVGYSYAVSATLGKEEYPTKNYESCCFPSGKYMSLQIKIGEAEGQNWWCVLYPPLCLSAATDTSDAFVQAGLNSEQYNIITQTEKPKYKVRFKILEALG